MQCTGPSNLNCLIGWPCAQVSYLVVYGSLPNTSQLQRWTEAVMRHSGAAGCWLAVLWGCGRPPVLLKLSEAALAVLRSVRPAPLPPMQRCRCLWRRRLPRCRTTRTPWAPS